MNTTPVVSKEAIDSCITPYQIFRFYYPKLDYGKVVSSPFRPDSRASFGIFKGYSDVARFKDLATGITGDYIDFVSSLFNLNYNYTLNKINKDMELGFVPTVDTSLLPVTKSIIVDHEEAQDKQPISVIRRDWTIHDDKYWSNFGLTRKDLIGSPQSKTYPIAAFRMGTGSTILADTLAYCMDFYAEEDGIMMRKIYQPYSKDMKWRTNLNPTVVDGIKDLNHTDTLIITKSRKDRLVLNSFGYDSISTNSESSFIPTKVWEGLKSRYDNIILLFDNDQAGIKQSIKMNETYDIPYVLIPRKSNTKDISEFRQTYGQTRTNNLIYNLIKRATKT